jgi:hypothetical protein
MYSSKIYTSFLSFSMLKLAFKLMTCSNSIQLITQPFKSCNSCKSRRHWFNNVWDVIIDVKLMLISYENLYRHAGNGVCVYIYIYILTISKSWFIQHSCNSKFNPLGLATLNHGTKIRLEWQKLCLVDMDSSMWSLDVTESMWNQCRLFISMSLKVCGKVNNSDNIKSSTWESWENPIQMTIKWVT